MKRVRKHGPSLFVASAAPSSRRRSKSESGKYFTVATEQLPTTVTNRQILLEREENGRFYRYRRKITNA